MKIINSTFYLLLVVLFGLFESSCTKMDDYKKYLNDGPVKYPGKIDTVIIHPGNGRIQLSMVMGSDKSVTKLKVFWDNNSDSTELPLTIPSSGGDTVNVLINNLKEQIYNFSIYTYDNEGHKSVITNVIGTVYGSNYLTTLSNRLINSVVQSDSGGTVMLNWAAPNPEELGTEISYSDSLGNPQLFIIPPSESVTQLTNYKVNSLLLYKSLFLPDSVAIDTFSIDYSSIILPVLERKLNKANFNVMNLPGDIQDGGFGWHMNFLWDENYGTPGWATTKGMPQWFTFDLGTVAKLSRFKTWQAPDRLYATQDVKRFEVWGSTNPDPDGSWASWTELLSCESIKPSGLPVGQNSDADVAYATGGEEFILPGDAPAVRYIRIKVLETWGDDNWMTMSELTFWTYDR